ncbi:GNAT family N-acetyltransferase [Massilia sp. SR12]
MHLRPANGPDFETIASWIPDAAAARRWAGPLLSYPFTAADLPAALAIPGCQTSSHCLVDDYIETPLGFGQYWVFQADAVHLGRIIIAPDARGRGLGRALCQHLIEAALAGTQAKAVTLRAYRDNVAAVDLYESLGFAEVESESTNEVLFMRKAI